MKVLQQHQPNRNLLRIQEVVMVKDRIPAPFFLEPRIWLLCLLTHRNRNHIYLLTQTRIRSFPIPITAVMPMALILAQATVQVAHQSCQVKIPSITQGI